MARLPPCPGAFLASVLLVLLSEARGDCGPPKSLPNARIRETEQQSYPVGTRLTYVCIPGYELISRTPQRTECLATSQWSEVPAKICQGRRCPYPPIDNGKVAGDSELRLGDQITFVCDEGYRAIGHNGARCTLQGNKVDWDRAPPHCERIPCFPPPQIANGFHDGQDGQDYLYGSAVNYKCDRDFSLIGSKTIVCTFGPDMNGKWNGPAPECKVVKCRTPDVPNGLMVTSYKPSYTYQDRIIILCKPGFKLKDDRADSLCEADSTWQPFLPECLPDISPTVPSGGGGKNGTSTGSSKSVAIALGAAAGVIAVGALVVVAALKCRAHHKRQGKTVTDSAPESYTAVPHNTDISLEEKA